MEFRSTNNICRETQFSGKRKCNGKHAELQLRANQRRFFISGCNLVYIHVAKACF